MPASQQADEAAPVYRAPADNSKSLTGGLICEVHEGPPLETERCWSGARICPVCTPLGRTHEETRMIVRNANARMKRAGYWSQPGRCT